MKIKKIIQERIDLYVKEKYMKVFFDLLRNINEILKKEEKNKVDTIFQRYFKENKKEIPFSEKIKNYFSILKKSIFTKETYLNDTYSNLEISYLKKKAKMIRQKCNLIAIQTKKKTELIIEYYIKLSEKELGILKEEELEKIEKKKYGKYYRIKNKKKEEEEDDLDNQEKIINLFIGNIDFKKYFGKLEIIKIKKSEFVSAYLFKNKDDKDYENHILHNFKDPSQYYKEKMKRKEKKEKEKKYAKIYKKKQKLFSLDSKFVKYRNSIRKFQINPNFNNLTQNNNNVKVSSYANLTEHKINKNSVIRLNYDKKRIKLKNNESKRFKISLNKRSSLSIYSSNQKTSDSFPKIFNSFSFKNLQSSNTEIYKRNNNSKFYFTKTDLYY